MQDGCDAEDSLYHDALRTGAAAGLAVLALPGAAAACPNDALRIVVGYSAGGTGGIVAGAIADPLSRELGRKVVVDYVPGNSGGNAVREVAKAAPDGCTALLGQTPEIAINPLVHQKLGYDPDRDLQPVGLVATVPLALVVPATAPYNSVPALAEAARTARPALSFASAGRGTPSYYAGELLRLRTQSSMAHASFDGGGVALQAVIKGQVSLYFPALSTAMEEANKGSVRILAVTSAQRSPAAALTPTLDEAGLGPFNLDIWLGVFLPHGASSDIVQKMNTALNSALMQKDTRDKLSDKGTLVAPTSVQQFVTFVYNEQSRYRNFIDNEFCAQCPW